MNRRKRTPFWGKDKNDDFLIQQIIKGKKTATACPDHLYRVPDGDFDDGGYEVGDIVDVYDLKERLRCVIRITEVYETKFGEIPNKLWRGECNRDANDFQNEHLACWSEFDMTNEFPIVANHFELLEVIHA